ncbi:MAG TPA: neutral zinc metallopeptidase [Candidatus Binatia bacterium]|nr:neutral zinc metallopeptidase [Candidatus Binatia bacterium]
MRWTPGGRSRYLEDRRGMRMAGGAGLGIGGTLILLVLSMVFGQDFLSLFNAVQTMSPTMQEGEAPVHDEEEPLVQFVSFVLDDAQQTWANTLRGYEPAHLVLFRDAVSSACGYAQAATGPFYCPSDQKIYIDLGFYRQLKERFGAPGDFAQAYVLAHEIGHHVQTLVGTSAKVRRAQQVQPGNANELSVRMELQADCYAGVWAASTEQRQILERGDIEEGLQAAAAVGDDRLTQGRISPDSFTHGTSKQRSEWFHRGYKAGTPEACDTFASN